MKKLCSVGHVTQREQVFFVPQNEQSVSRSGARPPDPRFQTSAEWTQTDGRQRRFPKSVQYNIEVEYTRPLGWIRRSAEGKFVVNGEDNDDGGFLTRPEVEAVPYRRGESTQNSVRSDGTGQSIQHSNYISMNEIMPRSDLVTSSHGPLYRTSSPEDNVGLFAIDSLSSIQQSSIERSFPSTVSSRFLPSAETSASLATFDQKLERDPISAQGGSQNVSVQVHVEPGSYYSEPRMPPVPATYPFSEQNHHELYQRQHPREISLQRTPPPPYHMATRGRSFDFHGLGQPELRRRFVGNRDHDSRSSVRDSDIHTRAYSSDRSVYYTPFDRYSSMFYHPYNAMYDPGRPRSRSEPYRYPSSEKYREEEFDMERFGSRPVRYPSAESVTYSYMYNGEHLHDTWYKQSQYHFPEHMPPPVNDSRRPFYRNLSIIPKSYCQPLAESSPGELRKSLSPGTPSKSKKRIARVIPSMKDGEDHSTSESSTSGQTPPLAYTRDRLQGTIQRIRSGALRGLYRHSAPDLARSFGPVAFPAAASYDDTFQNTFRIDPLFIGEDGLTRVTQDVPNSRTSVTSGSSGRGSSGRGSKAASISHSRGGSLQGDLEYSPASRSASSGFGSQNTSQMSHMSRPPMGSSVSSNLTPLERDISTDSPFSEPSPSSQIPLDLSVDENYEFDSISPLESELLDKLRRCNTGPHAHSRVASIEKGTSDSELYGIFYPRPKLSKYDNTEGRVSALKEEFQKYRQKQQERQGDSEEMESEC